MWITGADVTDQVPVAERPLDPGARAELARALAGLAARRGTVIRAADLLGRVMGGAGQAALVRLGMNPLVRARFAWVAEAALSRAYDVALLGVGIAPRLPATPIVVASGAVSGFAGLAGFLPDATVTTLVILREVARIAAANGEDLGGEEARHACLEVFGLRGEGADDELGYFSARFMLTGKPLAALMGQVAARYGLVLGEKFAAQAVPVAGAIAGAALNGAFLAHYRSIAEAHFTVRRLERAHGRATVQQEAARLANPGGDVPFMAA